MSKETPAYEEWKVRPVKSEAIVKKFETIHVRSVSDEARAALKAAHKAEKP